MLKFSFVIPVYNAHEYIGRCLDSLLDQDIDKNEYEIICVNDGSKDNSLEILEEYSKKYPGIFNIITQENQGIGPARNMGIKAVKGKYTWFIDNDDAIHPNCLKNLYEILEEKQSDILVIERVAGYYEKNPFPSALEEELSAEDYTQGFAFYFYEDAPWSKIYRTQFILDCNIFFPNIFGEDTSTTYNLYSKTKKIIHVKKPLYAWFERDDSFSHYTYSKKHFETFPVLLETLKDQRNAAPEDLKIYFDYLILKKANYWLKRFADADIPEELEELRTSCTLKSAEIIKDIRPNLFFEIDSRFIAKQNKIKAGYENSSSWRATKLLRWGMKILRKILK